MKWVKKTLKPMQAAVLTSTYSNECNINSHSTQKGTNSIPSDREGQSVQ